MKITSRVGKRYVFVDDCSCFNQTLFLTSKDESFGKFLVLLKKIEKRVGHSLVSLRSDHAKSLKTLASLNIVMNMVLIIIFLPQNTPIEWGYRV